MRDNTIEAFFALVRAGLWEKDAYLSPFGNIDYETVLQMAEEQSVTGLVTAGLDQVKDIKAPQETVLQFIGSSLQIEQQNKAMNSFIDRIVEEMRTAGIYALLVKGQGIAQCYKKPLWRASGDVDFFLSDSNYTQAKSFLIPLSSESKPERKYSKELGLYIESWLVELHGTLRTGLSSRIDNVIDEAQRDVFYGGNVRSWMCGKCQVFLPGVNNDVFFVFTHFIKHFYKEEGANLRQICDWCRLIWTYKDSLNHELLESRIRKAGLMTEWKAFAALAVEKLGMPSEAMPFYHKSKRWSRRADKMVTSLLNGFPSNRFHATVSMMRIFPVNTLRFLPGILCDVNVLKIKERLFDTNISSVY